MKTISIFINVRGQKIKFYPKGNKNGHYFEVNDKLGFYTKDLFPCWGRPNKTNCVEICNFYLETGENRIAIFDSHFKK